MEKWIKPLLVGLAVLAVVLLAFNHFGWAGSSKKPTMVLPEITIGPGGSVTPTKEYMSPGSKTSGSKSRSGK